MPAQTSPHTQEPATAPGRVWILGALTLIVLAVLPPEPDWPGVRARFLYPLVPGTRDAWLDAAQNLALYTPLGVALAMRGIGRWRACLAAAGFSAATELIQVWVPGRNAAAIDILVNTAGALAGTLLVTGRTRNRLQRLAGAIERRATRVLRANGAAAARLSLLWALMVAALISTTAWLLAPSPPPPYFYVSASPWIASAPGPVRIGASEGGVSFRGLIDDVRLFSSARSPSAIEMDARQPVRKGLPHEPDIVASFSFDRKDATSADDESGRGHHGAVRGATWSPGGRNGGALIFGAPGSEVVVPSAPDLDFRSGMTLEAWVLPASQPRRQSAIITHAGEVYYLLASLDGQRLLPAVGGRFPAGVPDSLPATEPIAVGAWTHLAATYDGRTLRMYVNGALASTKVRWSPHEPVTASLNGHSLPPGLIDNPDRLRTALLADVTLKMTVKCGRPDNQPGPVLSITGVGSAETLTVTAKEEELQLRSATRAHRLGLHVPPRRFAGALHDCMPGTTSDIRIAGPLQRARLEVNGHSHRAAGAGFLAPWALIIHSELFPSWLEAACGLAWLGALALPFGWWARAAWTTAVGAAVLAATCLAVPYLWPIAPVDLSQFSALSLGAVAGAAYRRGR